MSKLKKYVLAAITSILLLFVAFGSAVVLSACKKKQDNLLEKSKNLTNYNLDINLDVAAHTASVKQRVDYFNGSDSIIKKLPFHIYPNFFLEGATSTIVPNNRVNEAYPNGINYAEFGINRVAVNGKDGAGAYAGEYNGVFEVELPVSLMPEDRVEIYFEFNLTLPNCEHRFGYGDNTINLNNFYPIACVYDDGGFNLSGYNANGDPFYSDMANYQVSLTADKNYLVAHTGNLVDESEDGTNKTSVFSANMVRDFALVLSNKFNLISASAGQVNVDYFYFEDAQAEASLNTAVDAINTFSRLFGTYPYNNFCVVKADFIQGGMEYPNLVMIAADIDNADDYKNVIVHETAHQWWYGMVGNDEFLYPWLDESLTDFCCALFYDENTDYNLNRKMMIEADRKNYSLFVTVYEDVLGKLDTSMRAVDKYATEPEYTYCIYVKGVLMYDSLYNLIGKKAFYKALATYFEQNKYTNVTPEKLISAFSEASKTDLNNFFNSWINGKVVIK